MKTLFSAAGRAFVRAFVSTLVVYAAGLLADPRLGRLEVLGVAALLAAASAGLNALTVYVPKLSLSSWVPKPYGAYGDAFLHGFLASWIVALTNVFHAGNLSDAKIAALAGLVGAFNAGVRALQGVLTLGETPLPGFGLPEPSAPAARPSS